MPEMPIDPEFGRNIPGLPDPQGQQAQQGQQAPSPEIDLMQFDTDVEELEDGSAIIRLDDFKGPTEDEDF